MTNRYIGQAGVGICLSCLLLLSSAIAFSGEDKIVIKTENGIPVVYNPKNPAPPDGSPRSFALQHDLTIGEDDTDPNSMFSELRSIQVDGQENIYALDTKEVKVKVYDKNGKFLRSFGKKGKGPGEIEMPLRMEMTPDQKLVIYDMGNSKLIFYSPDGAVAKEIPTGKYRFLIRFKFDSQGYIYGDTRSYEETKLTAVLNKFSPGFQPLLSIASFEEKRISQVVREFSPTFFLQITKQDLLIWTIAETDRYEIMVSNTEGKTVKKIIRDYESEKITGSIKEKLFQESFGERGIPPGYKYEVPGHFPAFRYFIIDDEDRLYVCTYAYEERDGDYWRYYDVFDAEGRYIAKFCHPRREMAFQVKKGRLYCMVQESEEGIPLVKRYRLIWK